MAVPGIEPDKVSGEIERGLNLRGEWEGKEWRGNGEVFKVEVRDGELTGESLTEKGVILVPLEISRIVDEGHGKFKVKWSSSGIRFTGIYRQDDNRVILCFPIADDGHPTSFRAGDGQHLLTLHRVKPRK